MTPVSRFRVFTILAFPALILLALALTLTLTPSPTTASTSQIRTQHSALHIPLAVEPLPPGVTTQTVLSNLSGGVVTMAFDPSGRLFFNEKDTGNVRLYANGSLQAAPVFHVNSQGGGEQGLLGIAVDPNFTANHYVYIYWTCGSVGGCNPTLNKITRFQESNGVGSNPVDIWSVVQSSSSTSAWATAATPTTPRT
jgi:glucose/arabinose dehydrogenase